MQREPGALRLAIAPEASTPLPRFCERALPFAVVGVTTEQRELVLKTAPGGERAIDMPMDVLLGKPPKMHRDVKRVARNAGTLDLSAATPENAAFTVLRHPTVASKRFLVTIGDRTVGGLNHRDQMVGPWQVPVADCAVTLADFKGFAGEAMSMGERTPLASVDGSPPPAAWPWPRASPTCSPRRLNSAASSSAPTGWPPAAKRVKTRHCSTPSRPWAWRCAPRSACRSRWAGLAVHALDGATRG